MKKLFASLLIAMLIAGTAYAQNVVNYSEQGGARTVIGGSLDVVSGGDLDIESGGALKIGGTAISATAAELNYLDITTLGTGAASKAVVLDAGDDYTWPATGILTYGGTAINATGAEINTLDVSAGSCGTAVDNTSDNVTSTIQRFGNTCVARFVFAATPITVTDAAGSGSYGTLKLVDLAEGYVAVHSCSEVYEVLADDGTLAQNNLAGDIGVGSVGLAAAQDGALANATDDDICDETAFDINSTAGPYTEITHPVTVIDGSATAADIALNVSGSAATADANGVLTITGQYTIIYSMEGDD